MDYQRLLLDHLDLIDQIVRATARRRQLSQHESDDFSSFVHLRFVEDDYRILRKFQQRSSLWTYLAMVIERLCLDYLAQRWGRWRPSAMAERLGSVAVLLEKLVTRDAHTVEEAMEILRTHHNVGLTHAELRKIWEQLPSRVRLIEVGEELADEVYSTDTSDFSIEDAARRQTLARLQAVLKRAFREIPDQDRVLIALHFDQDMPISKIAKLLGSSAPTLHRKLEKAIKHLRLALTQSGLDPREVANLIGRPELALSPLLRAEVERFLGRVRLSKRDG